MKKLLIAFAFVSCLLSQETGQLKVLPKRDNTAVGSVDFFEKFLNGSNYAGLAAPDNLASSYRLRLPDALPTSTGKCLSGDLDGFLTWISCGGGVSGVITVDGVIINGSSDQYASTMTIGESTHVVSGSNRASMRFGQTSTGWLLGQDSFANGSRDFFLYSSGSSRFATQWSTDGLIMFTRNVVPMSHELYSIGEGTTRYNGFWGTFVDVTGDIAGNTGTFDGNVLGGSGTFGKVRITGDPNGAVEIGRVDGTPSTGPYIDFHTDGLFATDYNSRIQGWEGNIDFITTGGSGLVSVYGKLYLHPVGGEGGEVHWENAGSYPGWIQDIAGDNFRFFNFADHTTQVKMFNAAGGTAKVNLEIDGIVLPGALKTAGYVNTAKLEVADSTFSVNFYDMLVNANAGLSEFKLRDNTGNIVFRTLKQFSGSPENFTEWATDLIPTVDNTLTLGRTAKRWSNLYSVNGNFTGSVIIDGDLAVDSCSGCSGGEKISNNYRWSRNSTTGEISGSLATSGAGKVVSFTSCPKGLYKGNDVRINDLVSSAQDETVRITASTCYIPGFGGGGAPGTITIETHASHSGNYVLSSATDGIREAAVDASDGFHSNGGKVRIPAGSHPMWGSVYSPESGAGAAKGVVFEGDGKLNTQITVYEPVSAFIFDYGRANEVRSLHIAYAPHITSSHFWVWGIEFLGQYNSGTRDVWIESAPNGIRIGDSNLPIFTPSEYRNVFPSGAMRIENTEFTGILNGGTVIKISSTWPVDPEDPLDGSGGMVGGTWIGSKPANTERVGGDDYFLSNISSYPSAGNVPAACIHVEAGGGVNITGQSSYAGCSQGLRVSPSNYQNVRWMFLSDVAFDMGGWGMVFHPTNHGVIKSVAGGSNVWIVSNSENGVATLGAESNGTIDGITLGAGTRIANNGKEGIWHSWGSNLHANGIHVCGNSSFGHSGIYAGIKVDPGISDFSFNDIISGGCDSFTNLQHTGIVIAPGTGSNDRYRVSGTFNGNQYGSISDAGLGMSKVVNGERADRATLAYTAGTVLDFGFSAPEMIQVTGATPIQWLGSYAADSASRIPLGAGHVLYVRFIASDPGGGFIGGGNIASGRLFMRQNGIARCVMQQDTNWTCSAYTDTFPELTVHGTDMVPAFNITNTDWSRTFQITPFNDSETVLLGYWDSAATPHTIAFAGITKFQRAEIRYGDGNDGFRVYDTAENNYYTVKASSADSDLIETGNYFPSLGGWGTVWQHGTARFDLVEINPTDANEGGQVTLYGGTAGHAGWVIDSWFNHLRMFTSGATAQVSIFCGGSTSTCGLEVGGWIDAQALTVAGNATVGSFDAIGSANFNSGVAISGGFSCSGTGCPASSGGAVASTVTVRNAADTGSCTIQFNASGMRVGGTC